jgi:hypothetical protein
MARHIVDLDSDCSFRDCVVDLPDIWTLPVVASEALPMWRERPGRTPPPQIRAVLTQATQQFADFREPMPTIRRHDFKHISKMLSEIAPLSTRRRLA